MDVRWNSHGHIQTEAEDILESAIIHPQWRGVRHMFSADPTILGHCSMTSKSVSTLSLKGEPDIGTVMYVFRVSDTLHRY